MTARRRTSLQVNGAINILNCLLRFLRRKSTPKTFQRPGKSAAALQAQKEYEAILTELVAHYGWDGLAQRIALRCFSNEPSIGSSLKVLRKTPWAREKVEGLYLFMLRDLRRAGPPRETR